MLRKVYHHWYLWVFQWWDLFQPTLYWVLPSAPHSVSDQCSMSYVLVIKYLGWDAPMLPTSSTIPLLAIWTLTQNRLHLDFIQLVCRAPWVWVHSYELFLLSRISTLLYQNYQVLLSASERTTAIDVFLEVATENVLESARTTHLFRPDQRQFSPLS